MGGLPPTVEAMEIALSEKTRFAICHEIVTLMNMKYLVPFLCLIFSGPVLAESPIADAICWPTEALREKLQSHRGNSVQATGLRSPEEVVEIWTGPKGDWTMVIRYSSGTSCIVAMGEHWEAAN